MRILIASTIVAAIAAGCGGHSRDPDPATPRTAGAHVDTPAAPAASQIGSLSRTNLTVADRARWRQVLRWPDGCEDAFQTSHASDDGGVLFLELDAHTQLVQVICAVGSYQPSSIWLTVRPSDADGATVSILAFPVERAVQADAPTPRRETEVFGEWTFDRDSRQLTLLSIARQTGDCGFWARYAVNGDAVHQTAFASKSPCPSRPGPHATLDATRPPPDWTHHSLE